ncbi:glutaredoxin family protein [Undibacterium arcticum]|uniref:Glutaredoxin family protein n=1 Tax=Undibacterium arcticum TaxID=1762892 RepID=A0ABV7EYT9_9BURK
MKYFFRLLRLILGPFMLLTEWLTRPRGVVRAAAEQASVDAACRQLTLYQFRTCPFCIKVRQELRRHSLKVELRDAQHSAENRQALLAQGGSGKVPCLKITDEHGTARWLYRSAEIISYLQQRFAVGT